MDTGATSQYTEEDGGEKVHQEEMLECMQVALRVGMLT